MKVYKDGFVTQDRFRLAKPSCKLRLIKIRGPDVCCCYLLNISLWWLKLPAKMRDFDSLCSKIQI